MKKKPKKKKRKYKAPKVKSERLYERHGLACGKDNIVIPVCQAQLKS